MNKPLPGQLMRVPGRLSAPQMRLAGVLHSNRFTLGGAIVLAIVIPELCHPFFASHYSWARIIWPNEPTLLAATIALLMAHLCLHRVGTLPLVNDKAAILPTFLISYAVTVFFLRQALPVFGRYHLWSSGVIGVVWYFCLAVARGRLTVPRLALAGGMPMAVDEDLLRTRIEWYLLAEPVLPLHVHGIVFDSEQKQSPAWERMYGKAVLRNIPVYDLAYLREMVTGRTRLRTRPELVFGQLLPSLPYLRLKRFIDVAVAIPALVLALPILAVAVLLIRWESPGSALFRQTRVGFRGRRFTCYKLRTMRTDLPGPAHTLKYDPRVTRIGRFLRKSRIDELPQIFNILKGEMSWIGPRPESLALVRAYQRDIPYYAYRHTVPPGITGWAAVHQGNVALTDAVTRKLEYDFYYIKHFSIWLDFVITLMTIRTVITGYGSR